MVIEVKKSRMFWGKKPRKKYRNHPNREQPEGVGTNRSEGSNARIKALSGGQ